MSPSVTPLFTIFMSFSSPLPLLHVIHFFLDSSTYFYTVMILLFNATAASLTIQETMTV